MFIIIIYFIIKYQHMYAQDQSVKVWLVSGNVYVTLFSTKKRRIQICVLAIPLNNNNNDNETIIVSV